MLIFLSSCISLWSVRDSIKHLGNACKTPENACEMLVKNWIARAK